MAATLRYSRLDPERRREQILDAANGLIAERGYEEISIEDIARAAGVTRGLVHHYFGGRKAVFLALLERLGTIREDELRPPVGRTARARLADSVSRWLDWTKANRTIYLGTIAPGDDIADPEIRRAVAALRRRAIVRLVVFHSDIAEDSPRLRHALECWSGLNRAATRRWLNGEATREATDELLALTLEHVLRTFGTQVPAEPGRSARKPTRAPLS
jgi:AcrR family transcriptional regulator